MDNIPPESKEQKTRLTPKQQRFVAALASGQYTAKDALVEAGYKPTTEVSRARMASELLAHPKIQNALTETIKGCYPNVDERLAHRLVRVLDDEQNHPSVQLKAAELLIKLFGWAAPTKHATVAVKSEFKLPEE